MSYYTRFVIASVIGAILLVLGLELVIIQTWWVSLIGFVLFLLGAFNLVYAASFRALYEVEREDTPLSKKFRDMKDSVERTVTLLSRNPQTGLVDEVQLEYGKAIDEQRLPTYLRKLGGGAKKVKITAIVQPPGGTYTAVFYKFLKDSGIENIEAPSQITTHVISGKLEIRITDDHELEGTHILESGDSLRIPKGSRRTAIFHEDTEVVGIYDDYPATLKR